MLTLKHTLKKHVTRFRWEDCMPYDCKVGDIKEDYDLRARMVYARLRYHFGAGEIICRHTSR